MNIDVTDFGTLSTGETVKKFVLTNNNGIAVSLINYGATLVGVSCPDRSVCFLFKAYLVFLPNPSLKYI